MRRLVLGSAVCTTLAGVIIVAAMPLSMVWRGVGIAVFVIHSIMDVRRLVRGHRQCRRLRIFAGGDLQVIGPDGCCVAATLRAGSVVFGRFAWLRLERADGLRIAELLRCKTAQNKAWRRFQVIWRHLGAGP